MWYNHGFEFTPENVTIVGTHHTASNVLKTNANLHCRSSVCPHFGESKSVTVYAKVSLKTQWEHSIKVSFSTELV